MDDAIGEDITDQVQTRHDPGIVLSIRLRKDDIEKLQYIAFQEGTTLSATARSLLQRGIGRDAWERWLGKASFTSTSGGVVEMGPIVMTDERYGKDVESLSPENRNDSHKPS